MEPKLDAHPTGEEVIHRRRLPPELHAVQQILEWAPRAAPLEKLPFLLLPDVLGRPPDSEEGRRATTDNLVPRIAATLPTVMHQVVHAAPQGWEPRGVTYYPPGGGVGWHTNSDLPGWRAYVIRSPEGEGYVRTPEDTYQDQPWCVNLFHALAGSWHCVHAVKERWVAGFRIPDADAARLLDGPR